MLTSLTQTARTSRASGFVGRLVTLIPMLDYSWTLLCGWVVHNIEFIISTFFDVLDGGRHSLEDHVHDLRVNHLVGGFRVGNKRSSQMIRLEMERGLSPDLRCVPNIPFLLIAAH